MVSAQWHLNPSAQRQSSAYPSAQWQSWASPLWEVCNILYDGPPGWGHWGPLTTRKWSWCPYRSPQWPRPSQCSWHSLLPQWVPPLLPAVWGLGVPQEHPLATGLPASRPLLPGSLEVASLAVRLPASLLVMWALTLCFGLVPLPFNVEPSFPWNFCHEVSIWNFGRLNGSAKQQWPAWRDVSLPSTQGIGLVNVPFWLTSCLASERYWAPPEVSQWGLPPSWQPSQQPP